MANKQTGLDLGLFILRIGVGLYMLLAGVGKVQGEINEKLGHFYSTSFKFFQPDWLPDVLAAPYGYALPWLEVLVGIALIAGVYTRVIGVIGLGMVASFTVALILKYNSITAQPGDAPGPFSANYIQCTLYLFFALIGGGRWSMDALLSKRKKS